MNWLRKGRNQNQEGIYTELQAEAGGIYNNNEGMATGRPTMGGYKKKRTKRVPR